MEVTSEIRVYMRHIRAANFCRDGMKDWFNHYGIDWRGLRQGIPIEVLEATGDKLALDVVKVARDEHGQG